MRLLTDALALQGRPQRVECEVHARFHGALGNGEDLGDLAELEALVLLQEDDLPLLGGERDPAARRLAACTAGGRTPALGAVSRRPAVCVVMASRGYPGKYASGVRINGLQNGYPANLYVFHSGTRREGNNWLTTGGRVLCAMGIDNDLKTALDRAYGLVGRIRFDGAFYRKDIGAHALQNDGK